MVGDMELNSMSVKHNLPLAENRLCKIHLSNSDMKRYIQDLTSSTSDSHGPKSLTYSLAYVENRVAEVWAVSASMISAVARRFYPHSIVSLFKSIILQKLTYGMEIVNLSASNQTKLDQKARCCLKSLLNISTHSKNLIHKIFNIPDVTDVIDTNTINLATQLLKNKTTQKHLLETLTMKRSDIS